MIDKVGAVLVTHNSEPIVSATWSSMVRQDLPLSRIIVVDDHSTDGTRTLVLRLAESAACPVDLVTSTSRSGDTKSRIAHNFFQGVQLARDMDCIALTDHDDRWLPHRLRHQVNLLGNRPQAQMLASNGVIMGQSRTLFDAFDIPTSLHDWRPSSVLRHVIRRSVAVGSATMIRTRFVGDPEMQPPAGWLHDRWWSIVSASQSAFVSDPEPVIEYRVSGDQQVGLHRGRQALGRVTRLASTGTPDLSKLRDLHRLRESASPECRAELSWHRLVATLVS